MKEKLLSLIDKETTTVEFYGDYARLVAYDVEKTLKHNFGVVTQVNACRLKSVISLLNNSDEIKLSLTKDDCLLIEQGNSKYEIETTNIDVQESSIDDKDLIDYDFDECKDILNLIEKHKFPTAENEFSNYVVFHDEFIDYTNSILLLRGKTKTKIDGFIIHCKNLQYLKGKKYYKKDDNSITIANDDKSLLIRFPLWEDQYPNLTPVLSLVKEQDDKVDCSDMNFKEIIETAKKLSCANIQYDIGEKKVVVSSKSSGIKLNKKFNNTSDYVGKIVVDVRILDFLSNDSKNLYIQQKTEDQTLMYSNENNIIKMSMAMGEK